MKAGLVVAKARERSEELGILEPRHDLDLGGDIMLAVPGEHGFELAFIAGLQADHRVERGHRQVLGHQRPPVLADFTVMHADWIALESLEHAQARERVGSLDMERAPDQLGRRDNGHRASLVGA